MSDLKTCKMILKEAYSYKAKDLRIRINQIAPEQLFVVIKCRMGKYQ